MTLACQFHMELLCHYGFTLSLVVLHVISKHFSNGSNTARSGR
jgi:hypothetical protein